jgi:hypothetical protein
VDFCGVVADKGGYKEAEAGVRGSGSVAITIYLCDDPEGPGRCVLWDDTVCSSTFAEDNC